MTSFVNRCNTVKYQNKNLDRDFVLEWPVEFSVLTVLVSIPLSCYLKIRMLCFALVIINSVLFNLLRVRVL